MTIFIHTAFGNVTDVCLLFILSLLDVMQWDGCVFEKVAWFVYGQDVNYTPKHPEMECHIIRYFNQA